MKRWVVDTNVPVAANEPREENPHVSTECRKAAIRFLLHVVERGDGVLLDEQGEIEAEYRRYLDPRGQPGVGDLFYRHVHSNRASCKRIALPRRRNGDYADLPQALVAANFDRSDRKFAALAKREAAPVVNAVDSDWLDAVKILNRVGIRVKFLCGCDKQGWFAAARGAGA